MKFETGDISPRLAKMLARAQRGDLFLYGFEVDDDTLARSIALSPRDRDHAIYHALFDRGAPHAVTISPLQPPDEASSHKELLKWVVEKQAESAALSRANAQTLAAQIIRDIEGITEASDGRLAAAGARAATAAEKRAAEYAGTATERWQFDSTARVNFAGMAEKCAAQRDRGNAIRSWIQIGVLILILAAVCATAAKAQNGPAAGGPTTPLIIIGQNAGLTQFTRMAGPVTINCSTGMSCAFSGGVWSLTATGGAWGSITGTLSAQTDLNAALGLALAKASNLSDLANAGTARTNLGISVALTMPGQFSVAGSPCSAGTCAVTFPALPNAYTADANSPFIQNLSIRRTSALIAIPTSVTQLGTSVATTGGMAADVPTATAPFMVHIVVANGSAVGYLESAAVERTGRTAGISLECMGASPIATIRVIPCGLTSSTLAQALANDVPGSFSMAYIVFSTGGVYTSGTVANHYMGCTVNGTTQNCVDIGFGNADTSVHRFRVFEDVSNTQWRFCVDGTCATNATDNPASGTNLAFVAGAWGIGATPGNWQFAYMQITQDYK